MKKIVFSLILLFAVSTLIQKMYFADDEPEAEILLNKNVEISETIFTSEKSNRVIDEKEIKQSIKLYLDSDDALNKARFSFDDSIWEGDELTRQEQEKLNKLYDLLTKNDENFSHYILNNTLPEGYQKESERISRYITAVNQELRELQENVDSIDEALNEENFSKLNLGSLMKLGDITDKKDVLNEREQKKIEDFLDQKNIQTTAFDRNNKK